MLLLNDLYSYSLACFMFKTITMAIIKLTNICDVYVNCIIFRVLKLDLVK